MAKRPTSEVASSEGESGPFPNPIRRVERRRALDAQAAWPRTAKVELARVWVDSEVKISTSRRRSAAAGAGLTVSVAAGSVLGGPPDISIERVSRGTLRDLAPDLMSEADGLRPAHLAVHFKPSGLRKVESLEPRERTRRERTRRGGAIFPPDDRYIYQDAAFPWCTVGLIETENGWGSGTMIGRRLVLTASHVVVWKTNSAGWMKFTPAAFGGTTPPFGHGWAERVIYWKKNGRRMNDDETAFDYAVVVLDRGLGELTGYAGFRTFDKAWLNGQYWQNLGYPGDIGGSTKPSFSNSGAISSADDFASQQQIAYLLGNFIDYQPGQSGGPYWGWWGEEPWPRVIGTASTLPDTPSNDTSGDNEGGGGPALSSLIAYARTQYP
jgi:V8-like Glu-specific endopeptidase